MQAGSRGNDGLLPPLLLTGGPGIGKTTTGRQLAESRFRAAFVDVDDIRQLVVTGAEAPWRSPEGTAQAALGAQNACGLARRFATHGFDVVIVDVLTPTTAAIYRAELPSCLIVHLVVGVEEARRRANTRKIWLTEEEFELLHRRDSADPPGVDERIDVTGLDIHQQVSAVADTWVGRP
jgi:hypothetical protein